MMFKQVGLYVILLTSACESAKILGVFPIAMPSRYILGNALLRGLAEAGHDVTMVSPFTEKDPPKNGSWRDIVLTGITNEHQDYIRKFTKFQWLGQYASLSAMITPITASFISEPLLNHTNMQKLMKSGEKFDIVIVCQFLTEATKALSNLFDAHLIVFSSFRMNFMLNHLVGNPSLPSYEPELLSSFPPGMSFSQRVLNTLYKFVMNSLLHLFTYPINDRAVKKYFPSPFNQVDLNDALYNVSLILHNYHVSISSPLPHVPCIIDIGGIHIRPWKLPDDLQEFLDNAKEGVIYMSLGSNVNSKDLPLKSRTAILNTFSKLKLKVLWKWEDDVMPGQPPNVKIGKWLPQQDVLAHPNIKLFITQGGLLSIIETVYYGVPIIAIPFLADQPLNAYTAQKEGYGIVLLLKDLSEGKLSSLIEEILSNTKYTEEAKRRSTIMKDRQISPLDNAVYWVEYVIRHKGAKHLRVQYLDLAWYQYYLLDVFAFILIVILVACILLKISARCVRYILNKFIRNRFTKEKDE
ncbi:hypothetical protein NQ318_011372 [Aromia moschata]|uniref:UDP-glucuronosyltransferase n=1 Tax=Aromia moschata TaxID=1265417 RepID=A0AAV8YVH2_9CUCU|nr:hypothetical protein NQ318_011372 [Aromia moschata]